MFQHDNPEKRYTFSQLFHPSAEKLNNNPLGKETEAREQAISDEAVKEELAVLQAKSWLVSFTGIVPACGTVLRQEHGHLSVSDELLLNHTEAGFFFGGEGQVRKNTYVGLPQDKDGHILIVGYSGSGKTTGIGIPTLQTWRGAIVATDIKGDLVTAYMRMQKDGIVTKPLIVLDPMDPETVCYDPWKSMSWFENTDVQQHIEDVARVLIPDIPGDHQPYWIDSARSMLVAVLVDSYEQGLSC